MSTNVLKIPKDIVAIDTHVHPNAKEHEQSDGEYVAVAKKYFKTDVGGFVSSDELASMYRAKKMMCVLLGKDARTNTGLPPITNDSIAQAVRDHPDTFIGFGAVDPYMGSQPMHVDDVAADFPNLTIIAAHPGWPWSDEVLAIAMHKANVFVDMSGWAPRSFPPSFVQYARTLLQDKMLFGSDWPMLTVERWQKEFAEYKFPENVVRKIMIENAKRVLLLEQ